ncbi:hypothetical protein LOC67_05000 [Stieleria sp. JC731]|uniref:hypothetical protein n=1 Tax=Stieleria sp. JC731 TaxID=2894195 RepID=UPI001E62DD12|nr:hypothetical protein [Stieleria sp. JC731]MCC9599911.1 hypothetical protein [Stieleria sp. JC731]
MPDTAAGKAVKCKCGKQFRVPGGSPAAAGGSPKPAAPNTAPNTAAKQAAARPQPQQRPAATSPTAASPAAAPAPAAQAAPLPYNPFATQTPQSGGILDELTDSDFSGVKSVSIPGQASPAMNKSASASKLLDEAMSVSGDRSKGQTGPSGHGPRPGFLTFLGVINGLSALLFVGLMLLAFGLINMFSGADGLVPEGAGGTLYMLSMIILGSMAVLSLATSVACFVPSKASWYVVLVSYGWATASHIFNIISVVTEGEIGPDFGKLVGRLVFGIGIWAFLHNDSVRRFYATTEEPVWKPVVADVVGFAIGAGLGIAVLAL